MFNVYLVMAILLGCKPFANSPFVVENKWNENSDLWEVWVWREQNVLWFQIAVDDVLAVQVLQGHQDLKHQHGDEGKEWIKKDCIRNIW